MKKFFGFFKPTKSKIALLFIFLFIVAAGNIQSYSFADDPLGTSKPFLYDYLSWFPFWALLMFLSLPIISLLPLTMQVPQLILLLINVIYFYAVSCFFIFSFEKFRKRFDQKLVIFWSLIFVALELFNYVIAQWISSSLGGRMLISGTQPSSLGGFTLFATDTIVFAFYAFLTTSIFFILSEKMYSSKNKAI